MSPDLAARKVIVAAYCYYVLDEPVMDDAEYDRLSRYVARHWDELDRDRQWALDTPEAIASSGAHIYFAVIAVDAAHTLLASMNIRPRHPYPTKWRETKKGRRYVTANAGAHA